MKISKFFSGLFSVLGTVLLVGTVVLCLISLNAEPKLLEVPEGAQERAEAFLTAVSEGDYAAAGSMMYGQPSLGAEGAPAAGTAAQIWEAFAGSISCQLTGEPYAAEDGIAWSVSVETLDVSALTASLEERARNLLQKRLEEAEDPAALYDEKNNFREEVVDEALLEAVEQALQEDAQTLRREVTLNLICRDGQWWVVPNDALLQAISVSAA